MFEEKKIQVGKYQINYVDEGKGKIIIFLHNGGGFWHSWHYQLAYFAQNYRVIALDWVGFGESEEANEFQTLDLTYRTLRGLVQTLGINSFSLAGNCIGASTALLYRQNHPGEIDKIILFNICPGRRIFGSRFGQKAINILFSSTVLRKISNRLLTFAFLRTPLKKNFPGILFGPKIQSDDPLFQRYVQKLKQPRQTRSRINLLNSVHSFTLTDFLDPVQTPVEALIIWGEKNRVVSLKKEADYHRKLLGIKKMTVIPEGGHLCMYEFPQQVNHLLEEYLSQ